MSEWWRHAVVYQVYVRSFADSDGDGIGDLPGITSRLPYLRDLGVDAVWVTPFYRSPQLDHGYDVADYLDVDPMFGTLADADALVTQAHDLGLKVIVDLVPNHTSSEHAWFQAALAAEPGSPERARYLFRTGRGEGASEPPNNWRSVFGGPAWTRVGDTDQWYLHLFDTSQPDLDWRNPEIPAMFEKVLRFWLDRDVDGFRIDVAHGLLKEESLRDQRGQAPVSDHFEVGGHLDDEPMWDQPEVHEVYRQWRRILAEYDGDRMAVAEAWTSTVEANALYVRPDELDQAFNFDWVMAPWSAKAFADVIDSTLPAFTAVSGTPTWVLSNHDVQRHATRYGGGEVGRARARAATLLSLALPGSAYLYQGEELGLEEVDVAPDDRQDPSWFRTGEPGRDSCRVPIPWVGSEPPYGFGPGAGQPWIPQPDDWAPLTVDAQEGDPGSTLEFYRKALSARRAVARDAGDAVDVHLDGDVLSVRRGGLTVVVNCGSAPTALPAGDVVIASGPVGDDLPHDTAVWVSSAG
ncbi:alpha-glucosidase [Nocardioides szechwanensis]|uniref:Alpha-glucosidase n=1 Tax=Nocardioides szechwanensis TaxID=1005944 RepID=A0A1G9Z6V9_9ACTN|nr:alpha-amylase family glycosyl hydrolase [Nocardioides szechwanensis]GEP33840.1 alpha-glucosidase [Nocardioides szechwanensis]SDN17159.1 alpha-glucosidase [Nocardioides szechwanensis]